MGDVPLPEGLPEELDQELDSALEVVTFEERRRLEAQGWGRNTAWVAITLKHYGRSEGQKAQWIVETFFGSEP